MSKISKTESESGGLKLTRSHQNCLTEEMIVNYLFRSISDEERHRIEEHITDCDLCYDAVSGARRLGSEMELTKQTMILRSDIEARYGRTHRSNKPAKFKYYAAAALLLISSSSIGYWLTRHSHETIADAFITPYSNTIPLTRGADAQSLLEEAMAAYEAETYDASAQKLEDFLKTNPDHSVAHFYCGISLLLEGQFEESDLHFQKSEKSEDRRIAEAARWYRALAYVKMEKTDEAMNLLKEVAQRNGFYAPSAASLMERLQKE
ncbi:hypothetical protein HUU58_03245 [bacterium]|nr:hypothetical protein [bacterium]